MTLVPSGSAVDTYPGDPQLHGRIDDLRVVMEGDMGQVRERCRVYLNWYSPPFNTSLGTHDAWWQNGANQLLTAEDVDLTRSNFPISRAVVDIWTSLEAGAPPTARAEPMRIPAPPPSLNQFEALRMRQLYEALKQVSSVEADGRSAEIRRWWRLDQFGLKNYQAVKRKNLYGFSWVKVMPDKYERRPRSRVIKNPTVVYPLWSDKEPDEIEMILVAYQMSARLANAKYGLGLDFKGGKVVLGQDSGVYQDINDRYYDSSRTMVWVEELWWIDRAFNNGRETTSAVHCIERVAGKITDRQTYEGWRYVPYVPFINSDERDSYGWSDIASVIDINDEFNRRLSQQGDIIGMYSAPRFMLLNAIPGIDVEMPGKFELIPLSDQQRIEQVLTRIDTYPAQQHFTILTDLLHRVTGLPPIVWGLINNAQTSGRALTASWKATETRLSPKLMADEQSIRRWMNISLNYARLHGWGGGARLWQDRRGQPFDDIRLEFPPMEPRDFQEVTMNEITKRDAGLSTTPQAIRATGDEAPEDTYAAVLAERQDPLQHPDIAQSFQLYERSVLENAVMAAQIQQQQGQVPQNAPDALAQQQQVVAGQQAPPPAGPGAPSAVPGPPPEGGLPPAQPGQAQPVQTAPPDQQLSSGTLVRNGEVSNQLLSTSKF